MISNSDTANKLALRDVPPQTDSLAHGLARIIRIGLERDHSTVLRRSA